MHVCVSVCVSFTVSPLALCTSVSLSVRACTSSITRRTELLGRKGALPRVITCEEKMKNRRTHRPGTLSPLLAILVPMPRNSVTLLPYILPSRLSSFDSVHSTSSALKYRNGASTSMIPRWTLLWAPYRSWSSSSHPLTASLPHLIEQHFRPDGLAPPNYPNQRC